MLLSFALASIAAGPAPKGKGKAGAKATASATPAATPSPTPRALDCEAVKARVTAESTQCPEEAHEAATIACSATGHARLLALDLACLSSRKPGDAKKSPLATPLDASTCRAVSVKDGSVLAEASVADYQGCMREVQGAVFAKACTGGVVEVSYLFQRGTHDPYVFTVRCP